MYEKRMGSWRIIIIPGMRSYWYVGEIDIFVFLCMVWLRLHDTLEKHRFFFHIYQYQLHLVFSLRFWFLRIP